MPYRQTTYYLGARYDITQSYDHRNRLMWRNVRISRNGDTLPYASELDLDSLWHAFSRRRTLPASEFDEYLRCLVRDPDEIDDLEFCDHCGLPGWADYLTDGICDSCRDRYYSCCGSCDEWQRRDYFTITLGGDDVCESCRNRYYSYCEECDGYYQDDHSYEHDHDDDSGCCESPQQVFAIRNDGVEPLANNTRVSVTLPAGTISPAGQQAIRYHLQKAGHYNLSDGLAEALGDQWQTRNGNYTKRLSRYAYQAHQAKLTPDTLSAVGCIARDHSNAVSVEIEVTRDFNQSASYFYHDDSCYWGSYSESRCVLKTNGAFGIRSFDRYGGVSGRAWVMPLRLDLFGKLAPTFDTMQADAFAVFNGYGDLGGYAAARIMAHMAGWTYRKIGFYCDPMYINAGGYLIAPEHIAEQYTDGSLYMSVPTHASLYESEMSHA